MIMYMNTISKIVTICLNNRIFPSKLLCSLMLLILTGFGFSQSITKRIDTHKLYKTELEKHLFPPVDTLNTVQVLLFMVIPEVDPNSSLRIIDIGEKSFLEVRYLEKNVWVELLTSLVEHRYKPMSLKIHFLSVPISKYFKNKMLTAFIKVIMLNESEIKPSRSQIFDGTNYSFRTYENGEIKYASMNSELNSYDFRNKVSLTNIQIINDIKNNSFNESNYEIYK